MPAPGTVFQLRGDSNHFWIIISAELNGKVLAVNLTDATHSPESPCHLKVGDHPVVAKPSVIFYRKAREFPAAAVDAQLQSQASLVVFANCSPELLKRIVTGAKQASDLTARFLDYL